MSMSSLLMTVQRRAVLFSATVLIIVGAATAAVWRARPMPAYVATARVLYATTPLAPPPSGNDPVDVSDAAMPVADRVQQLHAADTAREAAALLQAEKRALHADVTPEAIREAVRVHWDPSTQIVTLTARAATEERARDFALSLPRAQQALLRRQVEDARARAEKRAADNEIELAVARQQLQRMGQGRDFPADQKAIDEQAYRLNVTLHRLTERDQELARMIDQLRERLERSEREPTFLRAEILPAPLVQELENELARLEARFVGLDGESDEGRRMLGRMADLRIRIRSERIHYEAGQIAQLRARDRARAAQAERELGVIADQRADAEKRLQNLMHDKDVFLRRLDRVAGLEARRREAARAVEYHRAVAERWPKSMVLDGPTVALAAPRRAVPASLIPISIGVGLLLGLVAALLAEWLNNRLRTPGDVRRYIHLPLIGSVPVLKGEIRTIVKLAPRDALTEVWNRIGTVVGALAERHKARAVLVTSVGEQEGKSTCAANLAVTFARMGHRTILVDADLRRPTLHTTFGIDNRVGLSSFLTGKLAARMLLEDIKRRIEADDTTLPDTAPPGILEFREPGPDNGSESAAREATDLQPGDLRAMNGAETERAGVAVAAPPEPMPGLEQILIKTELENLWVIPSGPAPTNPAALVRNLTLRGLVEYLKGSAEYVIFDTPPLASAADALALVAHAEACLLVIGADAVTRQQVRWAKTLLDDVGARHLGVLLNRTSLPDKGYAYYGNGKKQYREGP